MSSGQCLAHAHLATVPEAHVSAAMHHIAACSPNASAINPARRAPIAYPRSRQRRYTPTADARHEGAFWHFSLPESGIEPLLRALIEGEAGILSLSIERGGLHDAFVAIAGEAAAKALEEGDGEEQR